MCFDLKKLFSETFLMLRRTERDRSKMEIGLHVKCPLFLPVFNETLNLLDRSSKNTQIPNFMKIRPVGTKL